LNVNKFNQFHLTMTLGIDRLFKPSLGVHGSTTWGYLENWSSLSLAFEEDTVFFPTLSLIFKLSLNSSPLCTWHHVETVCEFNISSFNVLPFFSTDFSFSHSYLLLVISLPTPTFFLILVPYQLFTPSLISFIPLAS
jgi:hypothetical protein